LLVINSVVPELFSARDLTFTVGERFSLGGEVLFMSSITDFPQDPFALQIGGVVWLQPGKTEKLCTDGGTYILSRLGAFYGCDRVYGNDENNKSNCCLQIGENCEVSVVITKPIERGQKFYCKLFNPKHSGLIDVQKHTWLVMIVHFLFEFEFEIDSNSDELSIMKDILDEFLGKVKSFVGVKKFLERVKNNPNCISRVLQPCVTVMEKHFPPGELEPVLCPNENGVSQSYQDVRFPLNHLLFSAIRDPFVFLEGKKWEDKPKIMYQERYIKRQQYLKNDAKLFLRPDLSSILDFAGVDGEYLFPLTDKDISWD
jgi:hypothetical protein